jgi:hypothetical protein
MQQHGGSFTQIAVLENSSIFLREQVQWRPTDAARTGI